METVVMSNEVLLPEVCRLLDEGCSVTLKVRGFSMNPFIDGDLDSVEMVSKTEYAEYDVVLAWLDSGSFVLHRIFKIEGDDVVLMGDGNLVGQEHCRMDRIHGRAETVITPSGRRVSLISEKALRRARLWRRLMPVRRWILAFYRRTILKFKLK